MPHTRPQTLRGPELGQRPDLSGSSCASSRSRSVCSANPSSQDVTALSVLRPTPAHVPRGPPRAHPPPTPHADSGPRALRSPGLGVRGGCGPSSGCLGRRPCWLLDLTVRRLVIRVGGSTRPAHRVPVTVGGGPRNRSVSTSRAFILARLNVSRPHRTPWGAIPQLRTVSERVSAGASWGSCRFLQQNLSLRGLFSSGKQNKHHWG